jgi:hypothetical protein
MRHRLGSKNAAVAGTPLWARPHAHRFRTNIARLLPAYEGLPGASDMPSDDRTFRRVCAQLQRELHRDLTPEEMSALRLAQPVTLVPVLVERRKADTDNKGAADRRTPVE